MKLYWVECVDGDGDEFHTTVFGTSAEAAMARCEASFDYEVLGEGAKAVSARLYQE